MSSFFNCAEGASILSGTPIGVLSQKRVPQPETPVSIEYDDYNSSTLD